MPVNVHQPLTVKEARLVESQVMGLTGRKALEYSGYSSTGKASAVRRPHVKKAIMDARAARLLSLESLAGKSQKMLAAGLHAIDENGDAREKLSAGGATLKVIADVHGKLPSTAAVFTAEDLNNQDVARKRAMRLALCFAVKNPERAQRLIAKLS